MNKFKRVLAMILVLVFVLGFMPVPNARAAADGEQDVAGGDAQLVDITANVFSSDGVPLSGETLFHIAKYVKNFTLAILPHL